MQNWVFLCSLDKLLQKNVIVFFFWKSNFKMALIWKKGLFWTYFSHFLVTREKLQKFLQHISHSHTYMYFAHPIDLFSLANFENNSNLSGMVSLWYESWCWFLFTPFWNNQKITKWRAKFKLECLLLICVYTNARFTVICKPRTLNAWGGDSVQNRNRKKELLLSSSHFAFYRKNYYNLIALLSHLEALCLIVTSDALNNCSF